METIESESGLIVENYNDDIAPSERKALNFSPFEQTQNIKVFTKRNLPSKRTI